MTRDEGASSAITQTIVVSAVCAVLGVFAERLVHADIESSVFGGVVGAVAGVLLSSVYAARNVRRASEAEAAAPRSVPWPLTAELARKAFREPNGELAWRRGDTGAVIDRLLASDVAIRGGEVWWLKPDGRTFLAAVQDKYGRECQWGWTLEREPGEEWRAFTQRCASEARKDIAKWPELEDLPPKLEGEAVYHLAWTAERGRTRAAPGARTPAR